LSFAQDSSDDELMTPDFMSLRGRSLNIGQHTSMSLSVIDL